MTVDMLEPTEVFYTIEKLIKDNHCMVLGDINFLSHIEHSLYMNGNNDDFKLFSGSFTQNSGIISVAVIKKTKELRDFIGLDNNNRWKRLICLVPDKIDGILMRVDGVYTVPKLGVTKSIRQMFNSIIVTLDAYDEIMKKGIPFEWGNLVLPYCFLDEYQEYWFKKESKPKRRRTHIPRGMRHEVFKRDNYTCCECGARKSDGATLHIDHKIPVSKGGSDELDNLQTLCSDCNLNKSDVIQR